MKKLLAIVICAIMVLSMIPAMALSSSAAGEGDWTTRRGITAYNADEYPVAPGYKYDAEGFHTYGASYKGTSPFFRIVSKEAVDVTGGFTWTIRVDEYAYKGESGGRDQWISFNLWTQMDMAPACTLEGAGSGLVTLHRGSGNGSSDIEPFWQTANYTDEDGNAHTGVFDNMGTGFPNCEVPMDDQGRELYTLSVKFENGAYTIVINDVTLNEAFGKKLAEVCPDGQIFIGVTIQTGEADSDCNLSIIDVNGKAPTGTDTAEPEDNLCNKAPIADSSTVPAGQPCLLWDATHTFMKGEPSAANCTMTPQGDNTYALQAEVSNSVYFAIGPQSSLSYEAKDFPVIAMLMKDYWGNDGAFWYAAGDCLGAQNDHRVGWSQSDDNAAFFGAEEEYVFIATDLSDYEDNAGRINNVRVEFIIDCTDSDMNAWYMNWVGYFRTVEDAKAYAEAYLAAIEPEQPTAEAGDDATEAPADDATAAPADDATAAPADDATAAPADDATAAPADDATAAPADDATAADGSEAATDAAEGGCSSVIGCVAIIMTAVAAAFVCKKH